MAIDKPYVPPPHGGEGWQALGGEAGVEPEAVGAAVAHGAAHETRWSRDVEAELVRGFSEPPPWNEIIGPVAPRGGPNGIVLHRGMIVAEWGDTARADMCFSIVKCYLSLVAGIAVERGLIGDIDEPVAKLVDDGGFASLHNSKITWRQLLNHTSEREGALWAKPHLIDPNPALGTQPSVQKGPP